MIGHPGYFDSDEELRREFASSRYFRCSDGMCGQEDCAACGDPEQYHREREEELQ